MPRDAEQALIDQIRPLLDDLEALIQTPDPEIARLQAELEVLAADIEALEDTLTSTEADLVAAEAEIERLRARIRELEGTPPDPDPDPDPEPARANPQATVLSSSVVRVSWTPVPGATGYLVGRDAAGGESGPWSTVDPATATSREFNFLKTATYTFTVQAQPSGPVETVQATLSGTTPTPDPDPDPDPNPNPSTGEIPGLPILGICVNGDAGPQDDTHLARLRSLSEGSMWYRHGFAYSGNDPYDGTIDRLAKMRQFDFKVLCRLSLGSNPGSVTSSQYANHVRRVAQAAKDAGWSANDIVFEYHNEYNGGSGTAQHYVNMAKAAYPVLKSVDPNYKVIGGSENVYKSGWQTWLDDIYRLGFGPVTDGLSWHDYAPQGSFGRTNDMWAILTKYGQQDKMLWMTETGASTRKSGGHDGGPVSNSTGSAEGGMSYAGQARRIVALLQQFGTKTFGPNGKKISHVILYVDLDRPNLATSSPHEAFFGLWENTSNWVRTPKPAVQAIRDLYST